MSWFRDYINSSVGAKHVMAVTGLMLTVFVFIHMVGNLAIFAGRDALNSYAATLQSAGLLLWVARLGLLAAVIAHVVIALRLAAHNKAARPVKYQVYRPIQSAPYARAMAWTGLLTLAFIVYHLLHFTFGQLSPDTFHLTETLPDGTVRHDVYGMVIAGFAEPAIAISYVIAMALLALHLAHGVSSMFQSLGLKHPKYNNIIRSAGPAYAVLVLIGNCAMPIAVWAGIIS